MTKEKLLQILNYNPVTGEFTWKQTSRRGFIGRRAGYVNKLGYVTIRIEGTLYYAHRLVWLIETGKFPIQEIDHINKNPADNRSSNLRDCSHTDNMRNTNRHLQRIGYSFDKTHKKWKVYLDRPGEKRVNLGTVKTKEDAIILLEKGKMNAIQKTFPPRSSP